MDDFCVLLARYGFAKKDHETVREFIRSLPPLPEDGLGFAEELLQAYERIRFGQELKLKQIPALGTQLNSLQSSLKKATDWAPS